MWIVRWIRNWWASRQPASGRHGRHPESLTTYQKPDSVNHHHHHERAPGWNVAVSTSCLHRSLSWASRHAELSPWLSGWRSAFRVRSQVWTSWAASPVPGLRLQSLGSPRVDVCRALKVSCESLICATCPKKRSRLVWMNGSSCGGEPASSFIQLYFNPAVPISIRDWLLVI